MSKYAFIASIVLAFCYKGIVCCDAQEHISESAIQCDLSLSKFDAAFNQETNKGEINLIDKVKLSNLDHVKEYLLNTISFNEVRLNKYKDRLKKCQTGEDVQYWLKKIESTEKKIKKHEKFLLDIEMLKMRVTNS
jgi:hypothetical protein